LTLGNQISSKLIGVLKHRGERADYYVFDNSKPKLYSGSCNVIKSINFMYRKNKNGFSMRVGKKAFLERMNLVLDIFARFNSYERTERDEYWVFDFTHAKELMLVDTILCSLFQDKNTNYKKSFYTFSLAKIFKGCSSLKDYSIKLFGVDSGEEVLLNVISRMSPIHN